MLIHVRRRRLTRRLILEVILFSSLVTVIATAYQLYNEYDRDVSLIERRFDLIEESYLGSIVENVWVADTERLQTLVEGVQRLPDFVHTRVVGDGGLVVEAGAMASDSRVITREYPLVYTHRGQSLRIGTLHAMASLEGVYDRILDRLWTILISNAIKTFLVAIFMFWALHRLVTRHLSDMADYAHSFTPEQLDRPLVLDRKARSADDPDELDELVIAVNRMRESLKTSYAALRTLNNELEERVRHRTGELERQVEVRRSAEEALQASEQRFRDMVEADSDWQWEIGPDLRFTYFSPSAEHILGIPPERFIGKTRAEVAEGPQADGVEEHMAMLEEHQPFRDFTYTVKRDNGEVVYLRVSGKPIFDDLGTFLGYRGIGTNVTELVRAKQARAEAEQRYRGLIELSPVAVLVARDGKFVFANPSAAGVLGASSPDDLIGLKIGRFIDGRRMARRREDGDDGSMGGRFIEQEVTRLDDRRVFVEWANRLIPFEGGRAHLILLTDVTERHEAEARLRQAKEDAELASRTKSEFLATMSHELRTPLNAIIGFSDTIIAELFGPLANPQYRQYVEHIHESGVHLLELINDVLDVSAVEAGKLDLNEAWIELGDLAAAVVRLVSPRAENGKVKVVNGVGAEGPTLFADERRTKQILLNLMSNAVKFTPEGGQVSLEAALEDNGELRVTVADSGIGMSPEEIEIALRPFGQVDSSLARRYEGTGLGLPLVQGFIAAHGGSLEIDSRPGEGTRVTVIFPAERVVFEGADGDGSRVALKN